MHDTPARTQDHGAGPGPQAGGPPSPDLVALMRRRLASGARAAAALTASAETIAGIAQVVVTALKAGGTVYTCGNGGSAAEALHLAEELAGAYRDRSRPPCRAVSLAADPTLLTCTANDFGFAEVFARPARALLRPEDVLVVLTTSGRSGNILRVLDVARERGATTVGLLGGDGGPALSRCDHAVIPPADGDSAHTQEAHLAIVHLICEAVDSAFGAEASSC